MLFTPRPTAILMKQHVSGWVEIRYGRVRWMRGMLLSGFNCARRVPMHVVLRRLLCMCLCTNNSTFVRSPGRTAELEYDGGGWPPPHSVEMHDCGTL